MKEPKYSSALRSNADGKWYTGGGCHSDDFAWAKADADISYEDNPKHQFGVMDLETKEMVYTTAEAVPQTRGKSRK